MDDFDDADTVAADPPVEDAGLSVGDVTDGSTPDEQRDVGVGTDA